MKIRTLLDELDGRNCRNRFGRNNEYLLLGRSIEDILIPFAVRAANPSRFLPRWVLEFQSVTVYSRFAEKSLELIIMPIANFCETANELSKSDEIKAQQ